MSFKNPTWLDLLKHFCLATLALVLIILFVFYIYLPISTNHGESMTVPDLEGIQLADLSEFLEERDLRYEVESDSGYSAKYPPLAVLKQFPLANAKVKEGRKIYITLNSQAPPEVKMPRLIQQSLKNAQLELRSMGLALGEIIYKPDYAMNSILEQSFKGKPIAEGTLIPKGSKVDFVVGDGLGDQTFQMLDLTSLDLEEAVFVMRGYGLKLGDVFYEKEGQKIIIKNNYSGEEEEEVVEVSSGLIFKHSPGSSRKAKIGQSVDLWIVELDTLSRSDRPVLSSED